MKHLIKTIKDSGSIKNIRESFKTRQVKYGGYATLITIGIIVGLILLNLLIGQFPAPLQVDLTWSNIFTLSPETLQALDQVKSPVRIYGLWQSGESPAIAGRNFLEDLMPILNLYLARNSSISFETLDPDRNPWLGLRYDNDNAGLPRGSLIVEGELGFRVIRPFELFDMVQNQQGGIEIRGVAIERRITSAINFIGIGTMPVVYEIIGHGQARGLTDLRIDGLLEDENYVLRQINLIMTDIPDDASMLLLNNPQRDLTDFEAERILDYLEAGGRLLAAADFRIGGLENLNMVMASYGIGFDYGFTVEVDNNYMRVAMFNSFFSPDFLEHEITSPLDKATDPVLLRIAMSLSETAARRRDLQITPLLASSPSAFLRIDLEQTSQAQIPGDVPGPVTIGMAVIDPSWIDPNNPVPQARIVAISSGDLVEYPFPGNISLFMNSVKWLAEQAENITVRSRSLFTLQLRMDLTQIIVFGLLFVAVIPLGFFISGLVVWLKRRHL